MKKIHFLILNLFILYNVQAQNFFTLGSATWNINSNNWSTDGTNGCNCSPGGVLNATVIIRSSHVVDVPNSTTIEINNSIEVQNGGTLNLTNGNTNAITSLISNFGSTINVNGGTLNLSNPTSTTINGTLRNASSNLNPIPNGLTFSNNGIYIHAKNGGVIPTATWNTASECRITGVTTTTITPGTSFNQNFGNFTWDCVNQALPQPFNGNMTVAGNIEILNTGTGSGSVVLATGGNFTLTTNNFILNPAVGQVAKFFLANGSRTGTLDLKGNFNDGILPSGTVEFGLVGTGNAIANISFTGTNNQIFNPPPFFRDSQINYQYNLTINKSGPNNKVIFVPLNYNFVPPNILSNTINVINGVFSISRNSPNNQVIDIDNIQGAGTLEMINGSHILNIYGNNSTIANLTTDGSDTQIYYLRAGNQNVFPSSNYRTVGFRGGSGIKTSQGAIVVNQNLLIDTGVNFDVSVSSFVIALRGNWINKGIFTPRNGKVEFIGANPQIIGDNVSTTFYDLTINNTTNVTIANGAGNSVTVLNNLDLLAGKLILNNNLTISGNITATPTNYVVTPILGGQLYRNVSTPDILYPIGSLTQYAPVTLSGGNGGLVGMAFDDSPIPNLPVGATDVAFGSWFMESPTNNVRIRFDKSGSINTFSKIHQLMGGIWVAEQTDFSASPSANYTTTNPQTLGNFAYTIFNPPTSGTITISPTILPNAKLGIPYNQNLTATGGGGTYTFSITSGILPNGLTLSASGVLSGTPLEATTGRTIAITVSDGTITSSQNYNFVVDKGDQFVDISSFVYNNTTEVLSATTSASLPVQFESSNPQVATIQGNVLKINNNAVGEAYIVAFSEGNNDYNPTKKDTVMYLNVLGIVSSVTNEFTKKVSLYPNPNRQDYAYIDVGDSDIVLEEIIITNGLGNKVITVLDKPLYKINIQALESGVYFVQIRTNKGMIMKRFVRL
ncbi:MAG: T9SS type A sorting domain-containing protein [Raineya sp.]|jgi:hypothetical protein|nr:T9SS type A sorting domain-containing protein [Raineya sp.]